jgi:hypothetical protein
MNTTLASTAAADAAADAAPSSYAAKSAGVFTTHHVRLPFFEGMVVVANLTKGRAFVSLQRADEAKPTCQVIESKRFMSILHRGKPVMVRTVHGSDQHARTCIYEKNVTIHLLDEQYMKEHEFFVRK